MEKIILDDSLVVLLDEAAVDILSDASRNKTYGAEALTVGDSFTLAIDENSGKLITGGEYNNHKFLRLNCTGCRKSISVAALLGTAKPSKYFVDARYKDGREFLDGYNETNVLESAYQPESRTEREIIPILATDYIGATFTVIAKVSYVAVFSGVEQTVTQYLFKCDKPTKTNTKRNNKK